MDKNTVTGLILVGLLFMVYNMMLEPPPLTPENFANDSTKVAPLPSAANVPSSANISQGNTTNPPNTSLFAQAGSSVEQFHQLENDLLKMQVTNKGGRLYSAEVKDYVTHDKRPLILFDGENNRFSYSFFLNNYLVSTQDYVFEIAQATPQSVQMRLYADSTKSRYFEQSYTLKDGSYLVDYQVNMVGFEDVFKSNVMVELDWQTAMLPQEKDPKTERYVTGVYFKEKGDDVSYLSETSDDNKEIGLSLTWVAFKQQFFNTTLIAKNAFKRGNLGIEAPADENDTTVLETASAALAFEYQRSPQFNFPMTLYIGPNNYSILKNTTAGTGEYLALDELVPLGWTIFGWVNKWIIIPSFNFLNKFIGSYGIIILVLTLIIKTVLFPLTYRSYQSFAKMNVLKPEIEELKAKYGKDAQKLQSEQMKLYGRAGVNPLGGCLPQLVQMPILFAMYRFFPASIELRQESFLWADDLSTYDSIASLPFSIPFYGDHVSLFCLLSAASSLIYMRLNQQMTPTTNDAMGSQMKMFQYIMPVSLLFFFNSFSAGLTYYFFLSNVFSFVQQYAIKNFFIDEEKIKLQIQENKKKPVKKSKFQQRLENIAKAQQEQQKKGTKKSRKKR